MNLHTFVCFCMYVMLYAYIYIYIYGSFHKPSYKGLHPLKKYWAQNRAPPHQIAPFLGHLPGEEAYGPLEASWPRNDPKSMTAA